MILRFVVKTFEEESSLFVPEVYKLLLHKNVNDLNTIIDRDKDMSKLLHCTQWIFNMLKYVLGRALLCYVPKTKNLGRLIYRNGADVLRSFHSLLLANHRSSIQIAQMEKENLKLTNKTFFSYYRWYKEEQEPRKSWSCSTNCSFRQNKDWQTARYWQFQL